MSFILLPSLPSPLNRDGHGVETLPRTMEASAESARSTTQHRSGLLRRQPVPRHQQQSFAINGR